MMAKFNEILSDHIAKWNMVWFGLIFWGSVFNVVAKHYEILTSSLLWYSIGLLFGIIAKLRGTWLWKV